MGRGAKDPLGGGIACKLVLAQHEKSHSKKAELEQCPRIQISPQLFSAGVNDRTAGSEPGEVLDARAL